MPGRRARAGLSKAKSISGREVSAGRGGAFGKPRWGHSSIPRGSSPPLSPPPRARPSRSLQHLSRRTSGGQRRRRHSNLRPALFRSPQRRAPPAFPADQPAPSAVALATVTAPAHRHGDSAPASPGASRKRESGACADLGGGARREAPGQVLLGRKKGGREGARDGRTDGAPRGTHCLCSAAAAMMRFMLLFSRQGKLRLQKWYLATSDKDKKKMVRELMQVVLARKPKMCSFLEWRDLKVVYKRYASLYFCCAIEGQDNELITLELIHRYVELLDKYFGSVCELDIIFNFEKAYFILDEFLMGGEVQDTSKKSVLKAIEQADLLQEEDESPRSVLEEMGLA
uniref:AP-1 complex subunit sigma-1A isoform X2 n=4 Tax=Episquamata TaxID=1329912 RepID=A0A6J0TIQ8_9SAUR